MKETKIARILQTFSEYEMKMFKKFIESPFFASRRDLHGYYKLLRKYHPNFELSKERFFEELFPGEKFSDRKLKNLGGELIKSAEKFLIVTSHLNNKTESQKTLASVYETRNIENLFFNTVQMLEKKMHGTPFSSVECYNEEEKLGRLKENFYADRNRFRKSINVRLEYTEHFTVSFLVRFLRMLRDKKVIALYNVPFESSLLDGVLECMDFDRLLEKLKVTNHPYYWLLKIYYFVYKATEEKGEDYFPELKQDIYANINRFTHNERYFLFNDLADFCSRSEYAGNFRYQREEFEIYGEMLKNGAHVSAPNEYMSIVLYRNIILLSCSLREFDWLERFINTYSRQVRPEYETSLKYYSFAYLEFEKGRFEKALENLGRVQNDFVMFKTDIRSLQLRIFFELGMYEPAFAQIDAFRHFLLESEEMNTSLKKRYNTFLRYYTKLLRIKESGKKKGLHNIEFELRSIPSFPSRSWLIKKTEDLSAIK